MQKLPLNLLEPGMVVARELLADNGTVLVRPHTVLDEKLIFRLENLKIKRVTVMGTPVQLKDFLPKSLDEKLKDNDRAFSIHEDNALMERLRVLVKSHFIERERRIQAMENPEPQGPSRMEQLAAELAAEREAEEASDAGREG